MLDGVTGYINRAMVSNGLYFVPVHSSTTNSSIQFLSFETHKAGPVATFEKAVGGGLDVSPDGRWILYSQLEQAGSELMLVENFR